MKAVLEFEVDDAEDVLKAIGKEQIPKTKITCENKQGKVVFTIESEDISALSAAINSHLRSMKIIYGIKSTL